ncbi:MAG: hypothetical protein ACRBN8_39350 [Nannocystales bacterium]
MIELRIGGCLAMLGLAACGGSGPSTEDDSSESFTTLTTLSGTESDTAPDDGSSGGDTDAGDEIDFLEVIPVESLIELDLGAPTTIEFVVEANYNDGSTADVTAQAEWAVTNETVGVMNGTTFEVPGFADPFFESTIITAAVDGSVGKAQVTVAAYDLANDFFFILPFNDDDGPQDKPLTFSTDVKALDVFINMDVTGSMADEINNLRAALSGDIIPAITAQVPDTQFGAGSFADFPIAPYGSVGTDQPFTLLQPITANVTDVQIAVGTYVAAGGNDGPESNIEALYQIATGEGLVAPAPTMVAPNMVGIGGVGFREGSFPLVVSITDALSHDPMGNAGCDFGGPELYSGDVATNAHNQTQAMDALNSICGRVIQIAIGSTGTCSAYDDGVQFAEATGATVPTEAWDVAGRPAGCAVGQCCTGLFGAGVAPGASGLCPMTYQANADGTGVDSSFSSAVSLLAAYGQFDVTSMVTGVDADVDGEALPAGTTTADFIQSVTPVDHGPVPLPGVADPVLTPTTFEGVVPDTDVIFTVTAFNDFVEQGTSPRLFTANIQVLADSCGELDDRDVFILVPPEELPPPAG